MTRTMDKQQDEQLSELYLRCYDLLYSYALALLRDPEHARELVSETFVVACRRVDALLASPNPEGWLVNTLRNVYRNERRAEARLRRVILENGSLADAMLEQAAREDDHSLSELEGAVSREELSMLKLQIFDGMTVLEISRRFGISVSAAKKRLQRARDKLKSLEK